MALDLSALERHLCESLCEDVRLARRPDGRVMLRTGFKFPDGDRFPIHVSETGTGGIRLSDLGHTLMHLSYEHDIDAFLDGTRGQLIERIVGESGISQDGGVFQVDTSIDGLSSAVFRFGQALTRVYDLTFLSRSHVRSTFYDDLRDLLVSLVDEDKLEPDYLLDELANAEAYPVDYRIQGRADTPLFVYGVPNRDKARLTTITLSHFNRQEIRYESLLIFEDQAEIPRLDLARLSDVGGEMISSLESHFPIRSIEFVVPEDVWTPAGKTHIGTLLYGWQELGWEVRPRVVGDELLPENVPVGHAEEIIEDRYGLPCGAIVLLSPAGSHYSGETAIGTVRREYAIPA